MAHGIIVRLRREMICNVGREFFFEDFRGEGGSRGVGGMPVSAVDVASFHGILPSVMTRAALGSISPSFIVRDVPRAIRFYCGQLGFEVEHAAPDPDPFFAIVRRDGVMIFVKAIDKSVGPLPNSQRHPWARWDAYVYVPDPDGLNDEFISRGVVMSKPLAVNSDRLRGFEITDTDGYVLFFGRPE
jgi:catechol 2,3-dioxygenase-like lactoylglutathione lyase family enzyme